MIAGSDAASDKPANNSRAKHQVQPEPDWKPQHHSRLHSQPRIACKALRKDLPKFDKVAHCVWSSATSITCGNLNFSQRTETAIRHVEQIIMTINDKTNTAPPRRMHLSRSKVARHARTTLTH